MQILGHIPKHPFAVSAHLSNTAVLTYAVAADQLRALLPPCLELDTFTAITEPFGFIAVALVQTEALRPSKLPQQLGRSFFLIGYRIFVRYTDMRGKRLRGLYILGSQTDSKVMQIFGNALTHYRYTHIDVTLNSDQAGSDVYYSEKAGIEIKLCRVPDAALPTESVFADWKQARRFTGPLPHTFSYDAHREEVCIVLGLRQNWKPEPAVVDMARVSFLDRMPFTGARLSSAFQVKNVDYQWQAGRTEPWPR